MSELRIIVDHMQLEYSGLFELNNFFKMIDAWLFERLYEKRTNKNFEENTPNGKFIEWEIASWRKMTDYVRNIIKMRVLMYDLKKVEATRDKEKVKLTQGKVIIYFDGYIEFDYLHVWDEHPVLHFLRTLYDKFIFKAYTERFEQRITYDVHHIYDMTEKYFNMYRKHKLVTRVPHFAH
jgi:hypothetical protein